MFGFLYEMLGGAHKTLPRRRRTDGSIEFDAVDGAFVAEDGVDAGLEDRWLCRGEVPGQVALEPQTAPAGELTLAEEMQHLASEAAKRSQTPT